MRIYKKTILTYALCKMSNNRVVRGEAGEIAKNIFYDMEDTKSQINQILQCCGKLLMCRKSNGHSIDKRGLGPMGNISEMQSGLP